MSKNKATLVTVIFAVMLAAIDAFMLKLWPLGFGFITGCLALYGFWCFAESFSSWLRGADEKLELPVYTEAELLPEDFTTTVEDIMREVEAEREKTS